MSHACVFLCDRVVARLDNEIERGRKCQEQCSIVRLFGFFSQLLTFYSNGYELLFSRGDLHISPDA